MRHADTGGSLFGDRDMDLIVGKDRYVAIFVLVEHGTSCAIIGKSLKERITNR